VHARRARRTDQGAHSRRGVARQTNLSSGEIWSPAAAGLEAVPSQQAGSKDGFVAVDVLVALAILATTLAFATNAAVVGHKTAVLARETRSARTLMVSLLERRAWPAGVHRGATADFVWTMAVESLASATTSRLCRSRLEVNGKRSGRNYRLSTINPCPPTEGPPL
jgi:hypothetical protein